VGEIDEGHCVPPRAIKLAEEKLGDLFHRRASVSEGERHLKDGEGMNLKEAGEKEVQHAEDGKTEKTTH
jgi:hypothetical protein